MYCQYITTKFQLGFDTWKSGYTPQNNTFHGENKPMDFFSGIRWLLFSDKPNTPWWNMLSSFYHMAGTEKNHVSKGLGLARQEVSSIRLHSTYCKPWHPSFLRVISHERVEALVFFRRPFCWKKVRGRGPFLGTRLLQGTPELRFPSRPRWGTWNMPCLCSPKIACSSAVSQRPRTGMLGSTFQDFLWFFCGSCGPNIKNYCIL